MPFPTYVKLTPFMSVPFWSVEKTRAVVLRVEPGDLARVDARGPELVADARTDVIVHDRGQHRRPESEGIGEAAGHVRLAAALEDAHLPGDAVGTSYGSNLSMTSPSATAS